MNVSDSKVLGISWVTGCCSDEVTLSGLLQRGWLPGSLSYDLKIGSSITTLFQGQERS